MRAGFGLDSIVSHWQIVLRDHRGSQVRCLELRFWRSSGKRPWTCPLLCLCIPHLKDHGVLRNQVSSIRGRHPTLHGGPLPGSASIGGSLTMCLGVDVLVPRQRASIELNQVRGHDPRFKAGPFQAGARRLVGHRRWSRGCQGRNQNPRCSPRSNLVYERPSEVVDKDLQLPHPFSPTCSPRSDFRICQDDRPRSRHLPTRLL